MHFVVDGINDNGNGVIARYIGSGAKAILRQIKCNHQGSQWTVHRDADHRQERKCAHNSAARRTWSGYHSNAQDKQKWHVHAQRIIHSIHI